MRSPFCNVHTGACARLAVVLVVVLSMLVAQGTLTVGQTTTQFRMDVAGDFCNEIRWSSSPAGVYGQCRCAMSYTYLSAGEGTVDAFQAGLRFPRRVGSAVPRLAKITDASIILASGGGSTSSATSVSVRGFGSASQAGSWDNGGMFDISSRTYTTAQVSGLAIPVLSGTTTIAAGSTLLPVLQEMVDGPTWPHTPGFRFTGPGSGVRQWFGSTNQHSLSVTFLYPCSILTVGNGVLSSGSAVVHEGDDVTLACNDGYVRSGSATVSCAAGGVWPATLPTCDPDPANCPALSAPEFGSMTPSSCSRATEVTCAFACNTGYTLALADSASRTCLPSGSWTGSTASCNVRLCPALDPPEHGTVSQPGIPRWGDVASIACNAGYSYTGGTTTRTCNIEQGPESAAFSGSTGVCEPGSCGSLVQPAPNHGSKTCTGTRLGDTCTFACNAGYVLSGTATRTCDTSLVWQGTADATCSPNPTQCGSAPLPAPSFGSVSPDPCSPVTGNSCAFSCNLGYYPSSGALSRTCLLDGWSGSAPVCSIRSCALLVAPGSGSISQPSSPKWGDTASISCDPGHVYTGGDATRACDVVDGASGAVFSGSTGTCPRGSCGTLSQPAPAHGSKTCIGSLFGDTCTFSCGTGYELSGSAVRTCGADLNWDGSANAACSPLPTWCGSFPLPPPEHGSVTPATCSPATDTTCSFACNTGYHLTGSATRTCSVSTAAWTGSTAACEVRTCPPVPVPPHGSLTYSDEATRRYLSTVSVSCDVGYGLTTGSATRTCSDLSVPSPSAAWTGTAPVCAIVDCGALVQAAPLNGARADGGSTTYLSNVTFTCNAGYQLVGDAVRVCQPSGTWSGLDNVQCSQASVTASTITASNSSATVASVWSFSVTVREPGGTLITLGIDNVGVTFVSVASGQVLETHPRAGVYAGAGTYSVNVGLPTVAGSVLARVSLNGLPFPLSPYGVELFPGPAYGLTSYVSGLEGGAPPLGSTVAFTVTARDVYGNDRRVGGETPTLGVTRDSEPIPLAVTDNGDGTYSASYSVGTPGVYALTGSYASIPLLGSPWVSLVGAECEPGTKLVDATTCEICPVNTYTESRNSPVCSDCPARTGSDPGSSSWTNCSCVPGSWNGGPGARTGDSPDCAPCPVGGVCLGGDVEPSAAPGFMGAKGSEVPGSTSAAFVACPRPDSCIGSGRCATGYKGRLCADCTVGYYKIGSQCYACPAGNGAPIVVALVVLALGAAVLLVWINVQPRAVYGFASANITLTALQIVALYADLDLGWHGYARAVFRTFSFAALNLDLAAPECSFPGLSNPYLLKWGLTMAIPLIALAVFAVVVCLCLGLGALWRNAESAPPGLGALVVASRSELVYAASRSYLQALGLLYLPLAHMTLRYLDCTEVEAGEWVMTASPGNACYDSAYYAVFPALVACILAYVIGIPAATLGTLVRARSSLDPVVFTVRYAFLVARFRAPVYWFEVAILVQKAVLAAAVTAFRGVYIKAAMAAVVLVGTSMAMQLVAPYEWFPHNVTTTASSALATLVLLGGVYSSFSDSASDAVVIIALTGLLATLAIGIVAEIVTHIRADRDIDNKQSPIFSQTGHSVANAGNTFTVVPGTFETDTEMVILSDSSAAPFDPSIQFESSEPTPLQAHVSHYGFDDPDTNI